MKQENLRVILICIKIKNEKKIKLSMVQLIQHYVRCLFVPKVVQNASQC